HAASIEGYAEIVTFLLESGADPNPKNAEVLTPLYMAADKGKLQAVKALVKGVQRDGKIVCAEIDEMRI
ncbi:MAG: ankyrin repeat domain-containing protein, partial [Parachlamydia sp.]|nr:ankyrin repeat domain-containing protein [Parachlamydia sp.]